MVVKLWMMQKKVLNQVLSLMQNCLMPPQMMNILILTVIARLLGQLVPMEFAVPGVFLENNFYIRGSHGCTLDCGLPCGGHNFKRGTQ